MACPFGVDECTDRTGKRLSFLVGIVSVMRAQGSPSAQADAFPQHNRNLEPPCFLDGAVFV
jgi:hypothetical protein